MSLYSVLCLVPKSDKIQNSRQYTTGSIWSRFIRVPNPKAESDENKRTNCCHCHFVTLDHYQFSRTSVKQKEWYILSRNTIHTFIDKSNIRSQRWFGNWHQNLYQINGTSALVVVGGSSSVVWGLRYMSHTVFSVLEFLISLYLGWSYSSSVW